MEIIALSIDLISGPVCVLPSKYSVLTMYPCSVQLEHYVHCTMHIQIESPFSDLYVSWLNDTDYPIGPMRSVGNGLLVSSSIISYKVTNTCSWNDSYSYLFHDNITVKQLC